MWELGQVNRSGKDDRGGRGRMVIGEGGRGSSNSINSILIIMMIIRVIMLLIIVLANLYWQ